MASDELLPKKGNDTKKENPGKCCLWLCRITSQAFLEEEDLLHYIGRVQTSFHKSVIGAVLLLLSYSLSIMSLTFGIISIGTCPCQPVLPTFLIIHGSAMSIRCLFDTCKACFQSKPDKVEDTCSPFYTLSKICGILVMFWTITGSIWVYSTVTKVNMTEIKHENFCDPMLYCYSIILVSLVLLGLVMKGIFLLVISIVYCKYEKDTWYNQIMDDSLGEFV